METSELCKTSTEGKGMNNYSTAARIRKLEQRNKGLIIGIFGATGVLVIMVILVVVLRLSGCEKSDKPGKTEAGK